MTFHSRSIVEFGRFFSRLSECLEQGDSLREILDLIRQQLRGVAAAMRIEDRQSPCQASVILTERKACAASAAQESPASLNDLLQTSLAISATVTNEDDSSRCTLWVFRSLSEEGFDAEDQALCEIVAAQLRRGLELSKRIGASEIERTLYSAVMSRLSIGVLILDLSGRVLKCSAKAEELLSLRDGLQLQSGKPRATCSKEDRDLQAAIRAAIQAAMTGETAPSRGLALTRLTGGRNLGVVVQPVHGMRRSGASPASTVAIYIRDPDARSDVESDLVRQLFALTPAEAAVARRLTAGLSLEDAASSLDISRNTARAHLRSIFSKSGITRQTELVRLMLNSAAVLGEATPQAA